MDIKEIIPQIPQSFQFNFLKQTQKMSGDKLFQDANRGYIDELTFFAALHNKIPHLIKDQQVSCEKALDWFLEKYKGQITSTYYYKQYCLYENRTEPRQVLFTLYDDLLIHFDGQLATISYLFRDTDVRLVEDIMKGVSPYRWTRTKAQPSMLLLVNGMDGIEAKHMTTTKPKLRIADNYNCDFLPIHKTILKRLNKKNDKGLVLLHGKPGTGKTNYIRYLIASLKKHVIFLPPNMAGAITNPSLLKLLISYPDSVLVIEDAENIVIDREREGGSPVSALLKLSDGLLSDCLNIQIICTFNTDLAKVDRALMRKGRLIAKYEFKELEVEKAQQLSDKLGHSTFIHAPRTLTAIYNQEELPSVRMGVFCFWVEFFFLTHSLLSIWFFNY